MAKIRCDIEPDGLKGIRLITDRQEDNKLEPFRFYLRVRPVIEKFRKDLNKVLRMEAGSEEK